MARNSEYPPSNLEEELLYYDTLVRQARLQVYTRKSDDDSTLEAQVVCVSPTNIADGSRVPDSPWPPGEPSPAESSSSSASSAPEPTGTGAGVKLDLDGRTSLAAVAAGLLGLAWAL